MTGNAVQLQHASASTRWLLAALLLLAVTVSAVGLSYSTHRARQMFSALESLRREENRLQVEWRQLLVERSALAAHARVESIARERLLMRPVDGEIEVMQP